MRKKKTIQIKNCKHCNKEFETRKTNKIYCCLDCKNKAMSHRQWITLKDNPKYREMKARNMRDWVAKNREKFNFQMREVMRRRRR